MPKSFVGFKADADLKVALDATARRRGISVSELIRSSARDSLDDEVADKVRQFTEGVIEYCEQHGIERYRSIEIAEDLRRSFGPYGIGHFFGMPESDQREALYRSVVARIDSNELLRAEVRKAVEKKKAGQARR